MGKQNESRVGREVLSIARTDESKALLGELHAHHVSMDVLNYLLNAASS